jgi:hypothetical protein
VYNVEKIFSFEGPWRSLLHELTDDIHIDPTFRIGLIRMIEVILEQLDP